MRKFFIFFLTFSFGFLQSQELNCTLNINIDQVQGTNTQIYRTLEKSLNDFINKTNWIQGNAVKPAERINCSMVIIITSQVNDTFTASIQVQSTRPVFNSSYNSPVLNYNDKDFSFNYREYEAFNFNPDNFDSNLMSVIAYYSYLIIGMDGDTFAPDGGTQGLEMAQQIANIAQASGYKGWSLSDGPSNRYFLINDMLSNTFEPFREAMYYYHIKGLDNMTADLKLAKENVKSSILLLNKIHSVRQNSLLVRVFFDAKADEIVSIFSGGPSIPIADLVDTLQKISPTNATKWSNIRP